VFWPTARRAGYLRRTWLRQHLDREHHRDWFNGTKVDVDGTNITARDNTIINHIPRSRFTVSKLIGASDSSGNLITSYETGAAGVKYPDTDDYAQYFQGDIVGTDTLMRPAPVYAAGDFGAQASRTA
jgi:hypothetical protein